MMAYMDNILVKSLHAEQHIQHLEKTFQVLNKYKMLLNPTKCVFGVALGNFLGFMVHNHGIEANLEKSQALLEMKSPSKVKDVQCLIGRIAALNQFIAQAIDMILPFFKALRKGVELA